LDKNHITSQTMGDPIFIHLNDTVIMPIGREWSVKDQEEMSDTSSSGQRRIGPDASVRPNIFFLDKSAQ
jgi:hypothetical protein